MCMHMLTINDTHTHTHTHTLTHSPHTHQDIPVGSDCETDQDCEHPLNTDSIEASNSSRFVSKNELWHEIIRGLVLRIIAGRWCSAAWVCKSRGRNLRHVIEEVRVQCLCARTRLQCGSARWASPTVFFFQLSWSLYKCGIVTQKLHHDFAG
jgi:hypothetical protein